MAGRTNSYVKPLEGLKDSRFLSGLRGSYLCAHAQRLRRVIKVEAIRGGDVMRGPTGNSRVFAHFNAGKTQHCAGPDPSASTTNRKTTYRAVRCADRKFSPWRNG